MSISSQITRINNNIAAAYAACDGKGASLPQAQNSATLAATILTIPKDGDQPSLFAPTISRNNDTVSISNPSSNGGFVNKYKIYNGDTLLREQTSTSFSKIALGQGDYSLSVVACGNDFTDSPKSNSINVKVVSITRVLTNMNSSNTATLISTGINYTTTLSPTSGHYLPEDIAVTIDGVATNSYTYDSYTGALTIPSVSGNIGITAVAYDSPKLRKPKVTLSGSILTVISPRYASTTTVTVDGNVLYTDSGAETTFTHDLSQSLSSDYARHPIQLVSSASGYDNSDTISLSYDVGPVIAIDGFRYLKMVSAISAVTAIRLFIDGVEEDFINYDGSSEWSVDLFDYTSIADGRHTVTVAGIGTGIADNRSNTAVYFKGAFPIYGVSGLAQSSPTLTRTDDAVGLSYSINTSSGAITSDFNDTFPWNETEIINDSAGKFLQFPEMFFRVGVNSSNQITDIAVSKAPSGGGNWYHVPAFAYGCYGAYMTGNALKSMSGYSRRVDITRAQFRTYAANNGSGYCQLDLYHRTVLDFLWLIEWATKNSQSIMTGRINSSGTSGGSSRLNTGGTDGVPTPSGFETTYGQMRYHYIEDFVGNVMEFVDGIVCGDANAPYYVTDDPSKFADTNTNMNPTVYNAPSSGWIFALGWDADNPFMVMPVTTGNEASASAGFCDYVNVSGSSYPVLCVGAYCSNSNAYYGVFYGGTNTVSYSSSNGGGRLLKVSE